MRFLLDVMRSYPQQTAITLLALLLAGIIEGFSLTALLPVLGLAMNQDPTAPLQDESKLVSILESFGLTPTLGTLLLVIVLGITLKCALVLVANRYVGYTVAQIATDLRLALLRALLASRWEYYLHQPVGALTNAMATESTRAGSAYLSGIRVVTQIIEAIVYVGVALLVSWQATAAAIAVGSVLLLVLGNLVRMSRRAGNRQTDLFRSLLSRLADTLQSVKSLKAMGRAELAQGIMEFETGRLNRALQRSVFSHEALSALYEPLAVAFIAAGLYLALSVWSTPFPTVMVLVVLLARVLMSLGKVQRQYQKMVSNESAYWSLQATIEGARRAQEDPRGSAVPHFENSIGLRDVHLAYGSKAVLKGLSLSLPVGCFATLVGPSGGGKTTVVDIITGILTPSSGVVLLDGRPLDEFDLRLWRRMIGYVPQETLLLHDSVLHNVTLGDPELSESDVQQALQAAGAWEFVNALPETLHSIVGERGGKLSGGQRQRLCIARALVHRPRLLILDEATSALDPEIEAEICETLSALRGGLTILAISHQRGLMAAADLVWRIDEGQAWRESEA